MRAHSAPRAARPYAHATGSTSAEHAVPIDCAEDVPAGSPATFSGALATLGPCAATLDTLIERLPVGVLMAERTGRVVYANGVARRVGAEGLAPVASALMRALRGGVAVRERIVEVRERDGGCGWASLDASPMWDARGAVAGVILTVADVTARRRVAEWGPIIESLTNL